MPFFQKRLTKAVTVAPMYMGGGLQDYVKQQLIAEVEGTMLNQDGFIITVTDIEEKGLEHGVIDHFTGSVKYNVSFTALAFRAFKNEVMDVIVSSITDIGIFALAGPLQLFISTGHMPGDITYSPEDNTYVSHETGVKMKSGSSLRTRIIGISQSHGALCALGTLDGPYLGLLV